VSLPCSLYQSSADRQTCTESLFSFKFSYNHIGQGFPIFPQTFSHERPPFQHWGTSPFPLHVRATSISMGTSMTVHDTNCSHPSCWWRSFCRFKASFLQFYTFCHGVQRQFYCFKAHFLEILYILPCLMCIHVIFE
jgi:hypothetical protein